MTALTTLKDVQAVAKSDEDIQHLHESDLAVINTLELVDKIVKVSRFGTLTKDAQTYFAAHILSLATTEAGGRGPLSSESIGGVSQTFTLPYLNQHTVIASTQYGLMYLELRRHINIPVMVIKPS